MDRNRGFTLVVLLPSTIGVYENVLVEIVLSKTQKEVILYV